MCPVGDAPLAAGASQTDVQTALLNIPFLCLCFFDKTNKDLTADHNCHELFFLKCIEHKDDQDEITKL